MDDEEPLNLLHLPDPVLEEIFKYCLRSLEELKRCCKFIKNFIETHSRLKRPPINQLELSFSVYEDKNKIKQKLLEKYKSNEIYDAMMICGSTYLTDESENDEYEKTDQEVTVQMVADKHAENIEKFHLYQCYEKVENVIDSLALLKHTRNLKKAYIFFRKGFTIGDDNDEDIDHRSEGIPLLNLPKLESLHLETDISQPFFALQNCSSIEKLHIQLDSPHSIQKPEILSKILRNCKSSLRSLKLNELDIDKDQKRELLETLSTAEFDLREFSFDALKLDSIGFIQLFRFLETQTNLEKFLFNGSAFGLFSNQFKVFSKLSNLKSMDLKLNSGASEIDKSMNQKSIVWKLKKLEKIKIDCRNLDENSKESFLQFPSIKTSKLKEILLSGWFYYSGERIEKMLKNNKLLTSLSIDLNASNFSCDNIFLILKYLKKLKFLELKFYGRALDVTKFDCSDNLTLPEIEEVSFEFNDVVTNDHVSKLLPLLSNLEEFSFIVWKNYNQTTLEIIAKELPKLKILNIGKHCRTFTNLNPNDQNLEAIQEIIQKYNINPSEFKFNIYCTCRSESSLY